MGHVDFVFSDRGGRSPAGKKKPVPQRAQEIAEQVASRWGSVEGISHVEAVKGYLNVYFETGAYARRVVDQVLASGADLGGARQRTSA